MSDEDSCEGDTGDANLQIPSNINSDDSAENDATGCCPAPTSRISVKHAVKVIRTFTCCPLVSVTS